jgi:hypothetical protein
MKGYSIMAIKKTILKTLAAALAAVILVCASITMTAGCTGKGNGKTAETDTQSSAAVIEETPEPSAQREIVQDSGGEIMPDTASTDETSQKKYYDVVEDLKRTFGSSAPDSIPMPEYISSAWKGVECRAYYLVQSYNETAFECTFPNATLQQVYPIIRPFYDYVLEPELPAKDADFEYGLDQRYGMNELQTEYRYISEKHLQISNSGACLAIEIIEKGNRTTADLWYHNCD